MGAGLDEGVTLALDEGADEERMRLLAGVANVLLMCC